ncbi:uncharacterized protein LOC119681650 [Teleopsis dalmanni]|uniref:uncharacterized protein LOC119681650 n=1 Tax=Teleopsis dalmanni TaxID=139649 RepID=UPI0018CF3FC5|nr:uncharacterized protein LOC119681650 [Teleopsis dalmanni]
MAKFIPVTEQNINVQETKEEEIIKSEIGNAKQIIEAGGDVAHSNLLSRHSPLHTANRIKSESTDSALNDVYLEETSSNSSEISSSIMVIPSMLVLHAWRKQNNALEKKIEAECSLILEHKERVLRIEKYFSESRRNCTILMKELEENIECIRRMEKCARFWLHALETRSREKIDFETTLALRIQDCELACDVLKQLTYELFIYKQRNKNMRVSLEIAKHKSQKMKDEINLLKTYKNKIERIINDKLEENLFVIEAINNIEAKSDIEIVQHEAELLVNSQSSYCKYFARVEGIILSSRKLFKVVGAAITSNKAAYILYSLNFILLPVFSSPFNLENPFPISFSKLYLGVFDFGLKQIQKRRKIHKM